MDQNLNGIRSILSTASVYNVFQNLLGAHQARARYVQEFVSPPPFAKVLDIGCGTGSILDYLPNDVEYVGFDMNPKYISFAKRKYQSRGTFFCERVSDTSTPGNGYFDIVLATAILHHLSDIEALQLISIARQSLKQDGLLITLDNVFLDRQSSIARYLISKDRGRHVRNGEEYLALAKSFFSDVETHVVHDMLRIPYTNFIMRCRKR